jgi:hypothetical protein
VEESSVAIRAIVLAMVVLGLAGCVECVTEGCDALRDRAAGDRSGIGGVIAAQSDVVANDCQECGFSQASIEVFQLEKPVASAESARAAIGATPPFATIAASERYNASLEPGSYLVCVTRRCVSVNVVAETVTTVNVKQRYGPSSFFIVDPASGKFMEQFGFEQVGQP